MTQTPAEVLWIDGGLLAAGGLYALWAAIAWCRRNGLRDPLATPRLALDGPSPPAAVAVFAVAFAITWSGIGFALIGGRSGDGPLVPGSHDWFRAFAAGNIVNLLCAGGALWFLTRAGGPRRACRPTRPLVARLVLWTCASLAIAMTLNQAFQSLHLLLAPDAPPPQHPALLAFEDPAWGPAGIALLAASAIIVAPLYEEVMFRGLLLSSAWSATGLAWASNLMVAVLFGLIHVGLPQTVVPLITFGLILGFIRLHTGALWPCVLVHGLFNARTILLAILYPELIRSGY